MQEVGTVSYFLFLYIHIIKSRIMFQYVIFLRIYNLKCNTAKILKLLILVMK
jgi:hypothetical protein